jgi:hypothetical protein
MAHLQISCSCMKLDAYACNCQVAPSRRGDHGRATTPPVMGIGTPVVAG